MPKQKTPKTYKGKSMKPGGGGRFEKLTDELKESGKSEKDAKAIAATIGRKKYGADKMKSWSSQGKERGKK